MKTETAWYSPINAYS